MSIGEYFLLFIFYSICGWLIEVINSLIREKKFVNRGFLIGPYCSIYGFGALIITLLLNRYCYDPLVLFVMSIFVCSILEYFTSLIMEKLFNARWWDYSNRKFNINGRICLETMIPFGILGCIMLYFINPFVLNLLSKIPYNIINISTIILFAVYLADNIISITIISKLKNLSTNKKIDSTIKISKEVKKIVGESQRKLFERIIKAFPSFEIIKKNKKQD